MPTRTPTERILTLHPLGKNGVRIERSKYDAMRDAILAAVPAEPPGVPFRELRDRLQLAGTEFADGASIGWYLTTVKLDLEARGLIARVPGARTQHLVRGEGGG